MKKKVLTLLLIISLMISAAATGFSAAQTMDGSEDIAEYLPACMRLQTLHILPTNSDGKNLYEFVTRGEFLDMVVRAMGYQPASGSGIVFSDIPAAHPYSGAIEIAAGMGVVTGTGGSKFMPDENITREHAVKIVVAALGYSLMAEEKGGFPTGYERVAQSVDLLNGVGGENEQSMIRKDVVLLLDNAMTVPLMKQINYGDEVEHAVTGQGKYPEETWLETNHQITRQNVLVKEINEELHEIIVITRNGHGTEAGKQLTYRVDHAIDISGIKNVPVVLWINKENEVIGILLNEDVQVYYDVIDKLNGEYGESTGGVRISDIKKIHLLSANVEVGTGKAEFYVNGVPASAEEMVLEGQYAIVVVEDRSVLSVNLYTVQSGGIVQSTSASEIVYDSGIQRNVSLREIDRYREKTIVIDGNVKSLEDLQQGMYFDYYSDETNDILIVFASTKQVTGTFNAYSNSGMPYLEIDGANYDMEMGANGLPNLYLYDGHSKYERYTESRIKDFLNHRVKVVLSAAGFAKYLIAEDAVQSGDIIGILCASANMGTFEEEIRFRIYTEEKSQRECVVDYKRVNQRAANEPEKYATVAEAIEAQRLYENGAKVPALYKFNFNANNEVVAIKKFESMSTFTIEKDFPSEDVPQLRYEDELGNERYSYLDTTKFFWLGEVDGELQPLYIEWGDIRGNDVDSPMTLYLTKDRDIPQPEVMLLPTRYDNGDEFMLRPKSKTALVKHVAYMDEGRVQLSMDSSGSEITIELDEEDMNHEIKENVILDYDESIKADGTTKYTFKEFYDLEGMPTVNVGNGLYYCSSLYDVNGYYVKGSADAEFIPVNRWSACVYHPVGGKEGTWTVGSYADLRVGQPVYYYQMWGEILFFFSLD